MTRASFDRPEFLSASLDLGSAQIDLAAYRTTGLRVVAVGPSGIGKTNAGLLIAEQLAAQGWQAVLMDPEGEISALYETVLTAPDALERHLVERSGPPIVVVPVRDAAEFLPFGRVLMAAVDAVRKPVFLVIDEGQIFSTSRRHRKADVLGEASDLVTDFLQRGRKRALDVFLSAHRFSGTLNRAVFGSKNLSLIGRQEDPSVWFALAPMFKGSGIGYAEAAALSPGEFFCFSRRGVEKVVLPMAAAAAKLAAELAVWKMDLSRPPQQPVARPATPVAFQRPIPAPRPAARTREQGAAGDDLVAGERKMLEALALRYPTPLSKVQLGLLSGYTASGGTFRTYLPRLARAGLVDVAGDRVQLTDPGRGLVGARIASAPQTAEAVRAMWLASLDPGPRRMLEVLIERFPKPTSRDELGTASGYTAAGGTFRTYFPKLRRLGLVEVRGDEIRASEELFG